MAKTPRHAGEVIAVAFSPDGRFVATTSTDRTARLWNSRTGLPIGNALQHEEEVHAIAFSPDGSTLATGSFDGTAGLWSVSDLQFIRALSLPSGLDAEDFLVLRDRAASGDGLAPLDMEVPPDLSVLCELMTNQRVAAGGGAARLSYGEWLESWKRHRQAHEQWIERQATNIESRRMRYHALALGQAIAEKRRFAAKFHRSWLKQVEPELETEFQALEREPE